MSETNQHLAQLKSTAFIKKAIEGLDESKLIKLQERVNKIFNDKRTKLEEDKIKQDLKNDEINKAIEALKANGISVDDIKNHIK